MSIMCNGFTCSSFSSSQKIRLHNTAFKLILLPIFSCWTVNVNNLYLFLKGKSLHSSQWSTSNNNSPTSATTSACCCKSQRPTSRGHGCRSRSGPSATTCSSCFNPLQRSTGVWVGPGSRQNASNWWAWWPKFSSVTPVEQGITYVFLKQTTTELSVTIKRNILKPNFS